jgi:hypothetical protein
MKRLLALAAVAAVLSFLGSANAQTLTLVVPANPLWTPTAISLNTGDAVSITASGSWRGSLNPPWTGPDGLAQDGWANYNLFMFGTNWGSLIAFVGPDPYQGHWGDGSFFPQTNGYWYIGSSAQFTSDKTGELWLGFNDDAVSKEIFDNQGSVTAQIVVPEPSTVILALLGGALLVVIRCASTEVPIPPRLRSGQSAGTCRMM